MPYSYSPLQLAWLAALKSGTYLQGREQLTQIADGKKLHCCLGVACVVINELASTLEMETNERWLCFVR